jgi:hypothetical protein
MIHIMPALAAPMPVHSRVNCFTNQLTCGYHKHSESRKLQRNSLQTLKSRPVYKYTLPVLSKEQDVLFDSGEQKVWSPGTSAVLFREKTCH